MTLSNTKVWKEKEDHFGIANLGSKKLRLFSNQTASLKTLNLISFLFALSYFIFLILLVAMQGTSKKWHQQIIKLGQQQPTNMFATKLYYTSTIPTYVHIRLIYTPHTHTHLIIAIDTLQTQTLIYIVSVRLLSSDFEWSKLVRFVVKN